MQALNYLAAVRAPKISLLDECRMVSHTAMCVDMCIGMCGDMLAAVCGDVRLEVV